MKILLIISSLFLILLIQSCSTTEPIPVNENIKITEIDAAVIEAYLNIQVENPSFDREVVIERNGQTVISFTASKTDTAITDTGLTENTVYKYKAKLQENGKVIGESNEVSVTTMQPTSHNFTWEKYTFGGGGGSSVLTDVAIIDENNIWAVGEIYMKDSMGNDELHPYNAVRWDGTKWELKRIFFYTICGQQDRSPYPAKSIFAFNENDIWISAGDQIARWDGNTEMTVMCLPTSFYINKLWGSSSNSVYAVGDNGNIAFYNGSSWRKIDSGTNIDIHDIWGEVDNTTGKTTILAVASLQFSGNAIELLQIDENSVTKLNTSSLSLNLSSIWFDLGKQYYVVGDGIFQKRVLNEEVWKNKPLDFTSYYTFAIRGNSYNDIFVVGGFGEILHYNGKNWKSYYESTKLVYGNYYSVAVRGNIAVAVGQDGDNAVITIGKRN